MPQPIYEWEWRDAGYTLDVDDPAVRLYYRHVDPTQRRGYAVDEGWQLWDDYRMSFAAGQLEAFQRFLVQRNRPNRPSNA